MRDLFFRYEWVLPFIGGVLFGIVWGAERRMRLVIELALAKAERDRAEVELDRWACQMVGGIEGGEFEAERIR